MDMIVDQVGPSNRLLEIDVGARSWTVSRIDPEDRRKFLGGKGLGIKLMYDRLAPGIDPLGPENILAVMPGVLLGTKAPCSGRFHALAKSPLTGLLTGSSCGGPFGMQLKTAGWDGLLLTGQAEHPLLVVLDAREVRFESAEQLWGLDTVETQNSLSGKHTACLAIGPAGEHLVAYANIASGSRFLGRGGLGAVLGSKNVKAVVATGGAYRIRPADSSGFARACKTAKAYIKQNPFTGKIYRQFGTAANVNSNNTAGILPVNNFTAGRHDKAFELSGEMFRDIHQTTPHTCKPCSIQCGHRGLFAGGRFQVPEYETLALLGSNLGLFDRELLKDFNACCGRLGLDTISTGACLAWAMEAGEKGLIATDLRFGSRQGLEQSLQDIAANRGFGRELGRGTRWLAERYGGQDFAMQVKGLELPGYDPRGSFGQGLAYAVANRGGCHLSAFMVALEHFFGFLNPCTTRAKAKWTAFFEALTCCVNALQTCQFTLFAYTLEPPLARLTPKPVLGLLMQHLPGPAIRLIDFSLYTRLWSTVTGLPMSNRDFLRAGERIHLLERFMNTREGIARSDDTLPERLLRQSLATDPAGRTVPLQPMLEAYYREKGYTAKGIPTQSTLKRFGLN